MNLELFCELMELTHTETGRVFNLGINMNIELDEVVVLDVSDDALELAAGGAQRGVFTPDTNFYWVC